MRPDPAEIRRTALALVHPDIVARKVAELYKQKLTSAK
jgi:hypothetical protein